MVGNALLEGEPPSDQLQPKAGAGCGDEALVPIPKWVYVHISVLHSGESWLKIFC